ARLQNSDEIRSRRDLIGTLRGGGEIHFLERAIIGVCSGPENSVKGNLRPTALAVRSGRNSRSASEGRGANVVRSLVQTGNHLREALDAARVRQFIELL